MSLNNVVKCSQKNKRVLIVGAGGFIGTNLVRSLSSVNNEVRAISRSFLDERPIENVVRIKADLSDAVLVREHCEWADYVVYLVTESTPATASTNVVGSAEKDIIEALKFFELCVEMRIKKLIYMSSGGTVYGDTKQIPTPESTVLDPRNAYAVAKVAVENYLAIYHQLHDLDYIILRVSNPYGPYQYATKKQGVIGGFVGLACKSEPVSLWGDGSIIRDYLYIDDLCEAIVKAIEYSGDHRVFNIASGIGHSLNEVLDLIRATGLEVKVESKSCENVGVKTSVLDITMANAELGWSPKTVIGDGISSFVAWYRQSGHQ